MKTMLLSDLITSKGPSLQVLGISAFVGIFIAVLSEQLVTAVGCIAAMVPFMYLFNVSACDEQNGWERFRLTLPITRRQVAYGRYASMALMMAVSFAAAVAIGIAVGLVAQVLPAGLLSEHLELSDWGVPALLLAGAFAQVIILLAAALSLPFIMRFGMTKGARFVPIVLVLALSAGAAFFGTNVEQLFPTEALAGGDRVLYGPVAIAGAVAFVLYCASALVSARLYERRQL